MRERWVRRAAGIGLVVAALAYVCTRSPADSGGLSGDILVSGSSTVEPVSALNAERFFESNRGVAISVKGPGTGDGFEIFCNGESDISDASRPIKPAEVEACEARSIEFIELKVAIDGLSVITHPGNDDVECLSFPQLYGLLGPESVGFDRWNDANGLAGELGGEGDLPDLPLEVTAPGEESGTYDTFVELVVEEVGEARVEEGHLVEGELVARPDYQASPTDTVIIEAVSNTEAALGWVGYAYVVENAGVVKPLAVDGGSGCVEPVPSTISSGEYPLARPLFIYVNVERAATKPALAAYVDFYLSERGVEAVSEAGYVPLEPAEQREMRARWRDRETGTHV